MRVLAAIAAALLLSACGFLSGGPEDKVEDFAPDDAVMNAAIEEARAGLPRFWELHEAGDGADFMLKVGFPTPDGGHEHMWVDAIARGEDGLSARLQNEPVRIPDMELGQRVPFDESLISDWALTRDGKTYGHYTTRVVIASLPDEEQVQYLPLTETFADGLP